MTYSVLMSVYYKEKPEYLQASIESILTQTVPTDDFVLVCDGPLTGELDAVIAAMQKKFGMMRVVRLEKNAGLGTALNVGLGHCVHDLVARMDSDDIAFPDRCPRQLEIFREDPSISIVSGTVAEFSDAPGVIDAQRIVPRTHPEIMTFARKRSPFNHPCVMFRKSAVETAGGYQPLYLLEDYFLWVRMLLTGSKGYNIQEPILWMRAGSDLYKRRSGWRYVRSQKQLLDYMRSHRMIPLGSYLSSLTMRSLSALAPNCIRKFAFQNALRK